MRLPWTSIILVVAITFVAGAAAAPPRITRPVIAFELKDARVLVTIAAGLSDGVRLSWKGHLIDEHGVRVPDGELTVLRIDKELMFAFTKLEPARALASRARLEP